MTFTSPPVRVKELDELEQEFAPQFSSLRAFVESWQACKEWHANKRLVITVDVAKRWFGRDLEKDAVNAWQPRNDPLSESHLSQYELTPDLEQIYIARGDLHDWTGIDEGTHEEAVARHAQTCRRCQIGIESRRLVDERAIALGKRPMPNTDFRKALRIARRQMEQTA